MPPSLLKNYLYVPLIATFFGALSSSSLLLAQAVPAPSSLIVVQSLPARQEIEAAYERAEKMKKKIQELAELEINHANLIPHLMEAQAAYMEDQSSELHSKWAELLNYDAVLSRALIDAWTDLQWLRDDAEKARKLLAESYPTGDTTFQGAENTIHNAVVDMGKIYLTVKSLQPQDLPTLQQENCPPLTRPDNQDDMDNAKVKAPLPVMTHKLQDLPSLQKKNSLPLTKPNQKKDVDNKEATKLSSPPKKSTPSS